MDAGIRKSFLRRQRGEEISVQRQEEFIVVFCGVWVKTLNVQYLLSLFLLNINQDKFAAAEDRTERWCLGRICIAVFHELCLGMII